MLPYIAYMDPMGIIKITIVLIIVIIIIVIIVEGAFAARAVLQSMVFLAS